VGGEPMTTRLMIGAGIIVGSVVLVLTKKANAELVDTAPTEA
jgi:drug/metabolite transporter (DMT)-like permease